MKISKVQDQDFTRRPKVRIDLKDEFDRRYVLAKFAQLNLRDHLHLCWLSQHYDLYYGVWKIDRKA